MVGYIGGAYRVLIPESGRILVSLDVRAIKDTIEGEMVDEPVEMDEPEIYHIVEKQVYSPREMDADKSALN